MQPNQTFPRGRSANHLVIGVIALTLLVAAALRLWALPQVPPGPHYDEAANGVLAAEIATGQKTPIFIPAYTGKEVLFFYAAAAWMRLLGADLLALRLTAALSGLLTVAATAWLAYELFSDDDRNGAPWLAALTAALVATSLWHVLLSRLGFRAITQPLLQALTLAALWRGLRRDDRRWLLLGGLLCGLTGYTYLAARAFPVALMITFVALLILDTQHRRRRLIQTTLFVLTAAISFAPLGLYFLRHPDAFTTRMAQVGPGDDWSATLNGIVAAFKMIFLRGDPYIRFNLPFEPLFDPVVALLFIAGLGVTIWRLFCPAHPSCPTLSRAREILLLVWLPIMLLPTALAVNEITPSNLRASGLIPLIFIFPCRGLWALLQPLARRISNLQSPISNLQSLPFLPLLVTCALLLTTGLCTWRAYFDTYAPRTDLYEASDGDLADIATYLNQTDLSDTTVYVGSVHYRHPTLAFLADAYSQIKWLVGASSITYPTSGQALYLFPRSATPDEEWLTRHLPGAIPIAAPAATDGDPAFLGYRLAAPPYGDLLASPEQALADFSGVVRLLRYDVGRAASGAQADVTLIWQVLAAPPYADLAPFYHLVDRWDSRWGQAEPFHYAAQDWTPGEIVVDRVEVPIAPGAPPGEYQLNAGLYSQAENTRLARLDDAGRYAGTTVALTLTVTRAETPPHPRALGIRGRLDQHTRAGLTLLGANLDTSQVRPGERVNLTLFWRADQDLDDYAVNLLLQDTRGNAIPLYSGATVHGTYPTGRWTAGEIVVDRYDPRLPLSAADAPAGDYSLTLTLTGRDGETLVDAQSLGRLALVATDRSFDVPAISNTPATRSALADQIEFLGYDLDLAAARPGGAIKLTLYWRALAEMDTDYTVFTHLLNPAGDILSQQDNPPVNGTYPTTLWLPGEIVTDPYQIAVPSALPAGDYAIAIGFYVAENGLRLGDPIPLEAPIPISP